MNCPLSTLNSQLSTLLLGMMCLMCCNEIQAQNQATYGYDLSGNRVRRVIELPLRSQSAEEPAEQKVFSEMLKDFTVRIYPNPTKGDLTVEIQQLPEGKTAEIRLYSMSGSLIQQKTVAGGAEHFNIGNQPAGIYLLRITAGDSSTEWKIIKQ